MANGHRQTTEPEPDDEPFVLNDRIFARHKDRMVKLVIDDILYIEADPNHCHVYAKTSEYGLMATLKTMEEKLPAGYFLRVHRSFLINLRQVDEVAESHVVINRQTVPPLSSGPGSAILFSRAKYPSPMPVCQRLPGTVLPGPTIT